MKITLYLIINCLIISCSTYKEKVYKLIGEYNYVITDASKFNNCYLSDNSFGYTISDLKLNSCGIEISNINSINDTDKDFIITFNYPIKDVLLSSELINNEGVGETSKQPLEIILDKTVKKNKVFIYKLNKKGKYRLLLG